MGVTGLMVSQGLADDDVPPGLGQEFLSAKNEIDSHQGVVNDVGQVIGGKAVGFLNDEIVELIGGYFDLAEDLVIYGYGLGWALEADDHGFTGGPCLFGVSGAGQRIGPGITKGLLLLLSLFAQDIELLGGFKGVIGLACVEKFLNVLGVYIEPL